ncbi:glycosyltransferase [Hydrogenovibrio kuenenii]|uniref:glycosyltransferase n=1 Tax=Hydrogenovibrio kuenenii TaxID=63658 RepID=UPI0004649357|nr:glycosyltransferase [Hydrogenovibrio kuenenii]
MKFSVIIPVYNGAGHIEACVQSIYFQQRKDCFQVEILVVDDCSTDSTQDVLSELQKKYDISAFKTEKNGGPGAARNLGLSKATGDWVLFLDSDDTMTDRALSDLSDFISNSDRKFDAVSFNWKFDEGSSQIPVNRGGRTDLNSVQKTKQERIKDFLSFGMDGSVIYTSMQREFLEKNLIRFKAGLHEDVDFIFLVYFFAENIGVLDMPLYVKNNRKDSIINSISIDHLKGYFRAFNDIYSFLKSNDSLTKIEKESGFKGLIGLVATRVRDICNYEPDDVHAYDMLHFLYKEHLKIIESYFEGVAKPHLITKYGRIYKAFLKFSRNESFDKDGVQELRRFMTDIAPKSWSCYDLHSSIFLGPDEVRACCKRFFVDNEKKGDVVLLKPPSYSFSEFTAENILKQKRDLYFRINKDEAPECSGCPFLEFKDWGHAPTLDVEHISFEYHSVCNMKCSYCSDTYYGGKKVQYDIEGLVDGLISSQKMDACNSIVWGGGEPTADKMFPTLLSKMANAFPKVRQRVITNATRHLEVVANLIEKDQVTITTSIDAGSEAVFQQVRDSKKFHLVLQNLQKYAQNKPENITVKYIVLDENNSFEEIQSFVSLVHEYGLVGCNFHISYDFNKEKVDQKSMFAVVALYALLKKLGARLIFFDDLLRHRLDNMSKDQYVSVRAFLSELGHGDAIADYNDFHEIIIWGAGTQTKELLMKSLFLKNVNVAYIVDDTPSKIGTSFGGYPVYSSKKILEDDLPVLISAVQGSPKILSKFSEMQLDEKRLIKGLIL